MGLLSFASSAGGGALLGGIATGLLGRSSAKATNEQTERLSSTAHQRATKDLRLAGLNPILSATGGMGSGASTPQLKDPGEAMVKGLGTGVSSALQTARMNQELKNLAATENFTKEQTKAIKYGVPGKTLGTATVDQALGLKDQYSAKHQEYVISKDRGTITEKQKKQDKNLINYGKGRFGYKPGYGKSFK
jgi:hypothetical protein